VPVWTGTAVAGIEGRVRVERVVLRGPGGETRYVAVDTVVFTGEWLPDHELARLAGLGMDPGTGGPACDGEGETSRAGVFAVGNLVHPVETADVSAQRAVRVGALAAVWLGRGTGPTAGDAVPVRAVGPLRWVAPNLIRPGRGTGPPTLLRTSRVLERPRIRVEQGGRSLAGYRPRLLVPNRSHHLPSDWHQAVDPGGGEVRVSVAPPR
jgi:hypothetical protein